MPSILSCPNCAAVVVPQETGGICPQCRTALPQSDVETMMHVESERAARSSSDARNATDDAHARTGHTTRSPSTGWLSSSGAIDHGRLAPGALLGGRYRIVGRLGRGGMGEVFRADDLKLGQAVALKFLPRDVDGDPARLTQLHTEVRMARQVSHPNVCRVYDIDEVDGSTFLSMEYVDGEDLASLLRRIGRFPEDRALEIARQICAGLAAAHERGVVHRDLKPANVMVDGTGKIRLTDFGLAGIAGEAIRAGTPAYMAPEQLSGGEVTARSDIYSFGLVLYEVFTGQRALDGANLAELINKREQSGILPPTAVVRSLDPKIESAIMRCLKPQSNDRPGSALVVAAALPGGDPLAAALAAGETPSPEMVAAAGATDALHPAIALALAAAIGIALIAVAALADRNLLYGYVPMQRSLDSLEDRAREVASSLGYDSAGDFARGLQVNYEYLSHISRTDSSETRWQKLRDRQVPVMLFWYRSSPDLLVPVGPEWMPLLSDPPSTIAGMTTVVLDDAGRLFEFRAVPPARDDVVPSRGAGAAWPQLFAAAGLPFSQFRPADPEAVPLSYADERSAWEGPLREGSPIRVKAETAAYRGRAVFFRLIGPWTQTARTTSTAGGRSQSPWRFATTVIGLVLLVGSIVLARNNLRAGRGDLRGATRISLFCLAAWVLAWTFGASHYQSLDTERARLFSFLGTSLFQVTGLFLLYVSLEPYVRRYSPGTLVSWSRVLANQIVDPLVGRDVLIGTLVGVGAALWILTLYTIGPALSGGAPWTPRVPNLRMLLDSGIAAGAVIRMIPNAVNNAMGIAIVFVLVRALSRSVWVGAITAAIVLSIALMSEGASPAALITILFTSGFVVPLILVLVYFGMLPLTIGFLVSQALNNAPLTLDLSQPYASGALWPLSLVVGLTLFGFYASRKGQPLFGRLLQD